MSRKEVVRERFSRAVQTYDCSSTAQDQAARQLATLILDMLAPKMMWLDRPLQVLEIGCGTGGLTRHLAPKISGQWVLTDLSAQMVAETERRMGGEINAQFLCMDGENPETGLGQFDLITSNLAFQWFEDLGQSVARLTKMLKPGGLLAFSTLGSKTFQEWRHAHEALGLVAGTPEYPDAKSLAEILPAHAQIMERSFSVAYASPIKFAQSVRNIGASTPADNHIPLTASEMRAVLGQLKSPMLVTYDVLHCMIKA